jgi:hypothetical protein
MEREVAAADHILIAHSPAYKHQAGADADPQVGRGVQYETRLIRNVFHQNLWRRAGKRQAPVDRFAARGTRFAGVVGDESPALL